MADRPAILEAEDNLAVAYDTADPAAVNSARKKEARKRRDRLAVVGALMEQKEGRAWIYDLLALCHCYETSFVVGQPDMTAFREGSRNIGLRIIADIQAVSPKEYIVMVEEGAGRV